MLSTPNALPPGTVIAGDFRIQTRLAEGGMGAIYAAEQLSTGRPRALKLMHAQLVADARAREKFMQEARVGGRIRSDHVVEVVGAGVDPDLGVPWIAMELLEGEDLGAHVKRAGPLPAALVRELFDQIADGLGKAHALGVLHLDLKPENLFLVPPRRAGLAPTLKVLDFGIARLVQENRSAATMTRAMGSPLWMAPEQAATGALVRPATDVWALGLIAFYLLTGRSYWRAGNVPDEQFNLQAILAEVLVAPLEPASARANEHGSAQRLPPGFDAWFARCVHRTPEERFPHATAACDALRPLFDGAPAVPAPASSFDAPVTSHVPPTVPLIEPPRPPVIAPRRRVPVAPLVAACVLGLAAVVLVGFQVAKNLARRRGVAVFDSADAQLSPATLRTLQGLPSEVVITRYFSAEQPPPLDRDTAEVDWLLGLYESASRGKLTVRRVSVNDETTRHVAENAGCTRRPMQTVDADAGQATIREVFRCLTISRDRSNERIEFVAPEAKGLEYELTAILRRGGRAQATIGFLTGHDEVSPEVGMPYLARILEDSHAPYVTRAVDLHDGREAVPDDVDGLMVVGPVRAISDAETRRLDEYLARGGGLAVFAGGVTVTGEDVAPTVARAEHGLDRWLERRGITLHPDVVLDQRAMDVVVAMQEQRVRARLFTFPAVSEGDLERSHPAVYELPAIITPFVSSLTVDAPRATAGGLTLTVLARSSSTSTAQREPFSLGALDLITRRGTIFAPGGGPFTLGVALQGPAQGGRAPRLMVVGSSRMFTIEQLREIAPMQGGVPTNVQMLLSTFEWLSQDPELLTVRGRSPHAMLHPGES